MSRSSYSQADSFSWEWGTSWSGLAPQLALYFWRRGTFQITTHRRDWNCDSFHPYSARNQHIDEVSAFQQRPRRLVYVGGRGMCFHSWPALPVLTTPPLHPCSTLQHTPDAMPERQGLLAGLRGHDILSIFGTLPLSVFKVKKEKKENGESECRNVARHHTGLHLFPSHSGHIREGVGGVERERERETCFFFVFF